MNKPHKHAELIKAWADGADIEVEAENNHDEWLVLSHPLWMEDRNYRIKPVPLVTKKYTFCDRIERTLENGLDLNNMKAQYWYNNDKSIEGKYLEWVFTDNKLTAVNIIGED